MHGFGVKDWARRVFQFDGIAAIESAWDLAQASGSRVASRSTGQVRMRTSTSFKYNHGLVPSRRQVAVSLVRMAPGRVEYRCNQAWMSE